MTLPMDSEFDWPDEIPENDFHDAVGAWPSENLTGVDRPEALKRIDALVNREIASTWQAQAAIWFWSGDQINVPTADRPDPADPDWLSKTIMALGRAAMRGRLIECYEDEGRFE